MGPSKQPYKVGTYYYKHFTDRETETQINLKKIAQGLEKPKVRHKCPYSWFPDVS